MAAANLYTDLKHLQAPVFTGAPHEDASAWIALIENRIEAYDIPNARATPLFRLLLSGSALLWYRSLTEAVQADWNLLRQQFKVFYISGGPLRRGQKLSNFNRAEQGESTVRQFFENLQRLAAGLGLDQAAVKTQFLAGLHESIRDQITLLQPPTLADALGMAEAVEGNSRSRQSQSFSQPPSDSPMLACLVEKLDTLTNTFMAMSTGNPTANPSFRQGRFAGSRGHGRGRGGHSDYQYQAADFQQGSFQAGAAQQGDFLCNFCGEKNHKAANCVARWRQQSRDNQQSLNWSGPK